MAPSKIQKAIGKVKDKTSIGLAKVANTDSISDLDVTIVKATRHSEHPADEKHIREILSLTFYSRAHVSACVDTLSRRLTKTHNWTVALKTLFLIHRLIIEGDPSYQQEIFFATRHGTRLLNMSAFRDTSHRDSWDFSAFIRTFALYIDEQLESHMHHRLSTLSVNDDGDEVEDDPALVTPLHEMKIDHIFAMIQRLQLLLQRLLSCQPTGAVKNNRLVLFALHPIVKESFQIYYDITQIMGVLIDRFMMLENSDCVKVLEIFSRIAKQFDDLDTFYAWCKKACIARSSDYPEVERITPKKLKVMEEFIHEKSTLVQQLKEKHQELEIEIDQEPDNIEQPAKDDLATLKALSEPENSTEVAREEKREETKEEEKEKENIEEVDLLNLREGTVSIEEEGDKLALSLFSGESTPPSAWEAFVDGSTDWETALVQSASSLSNQKASLGGGFDMLMLNGMYRQVAVPSSGSASSITFVGGTPGLLALPAPPIGGGSEDPFAASLAVAPPAYVQMSEMEKKHQLLMEEQLMWQQYAKNLESKPFVV